MSGLALFDNQLAQSRVDDDSEDIQAENKNEEGHQQEDIAQAFNVESIQNELPVLLINDLPLHLSPSDQSRHNKVNNLRVYKYNQFSINC